MIPISGRKLIAIAGLLLGSLAASAAENRITVSTLAELAEAAARSGQTVTMRPGVYRLVDFIPPGALPERRRRQEWQFLTFSGSHNTFQLEGVTIEVDTTLRSALRAPIHTDEFLISGRGNTLTGLTITNLGDGKSLGGAVLGVTGADNTLRHCTVHVQGSAPYGYGDLFGKGGFKHSGVHITGHGTRLIGCRVFTKAFGHAFYVQEDADDVHFEDCHAEGVMRSTDEILAETSGLAVERNFRTEMKNRAGEARVTPGYMKALSEDGFRTYGTHRNLTLKNCTARNLRGGFELRTKTAPRLENCTATGCERGFWISTGAVLIGCRGDAQFGPLLFAEGDEAKVELELLPAESKFNVHALAILYGQGSQVTIRPSAEGERQRPLPIMLGFCPPGMGEGAAPIAERDARGLRLRNETTMPVIIGARAARCEVASRGPVEVNAGKDIVVTRP
jgi:parallel beta-helix repeat protein